MTATAVPSIRRPLVVPAVSAAAGVIVISTLIHLIYAAVSPLDLAPDEAHYWDWSRNLDVAYYSKGPLVAWLIRAACELFGDTPFAVRLPAVVCHALLLWAWYRLAVESSGDRKLGLWVVACAATLPPVSAAAAVTTIDAPFLAAWAWAAVFLRRVVVDGDSRWFWPAAGCVFVGVLAKHTMLLMPVLVWLMRWRVTVARPLTLTLSPEAGERGLVSGRGGDIRGADVLPPLPRFGDPGGGEGDGTGMAGRSPLTLTLSPEAGERGLVAGILALFGAACLGLLPYAYWNATHGWVGVRHFFAQTGGDSGGVRWLGPVELIAAQFGLLLAVWFMAYFAALRLPSNPNRRFLIILSAPVLLGFLLLSPFTKVQPNWPAPAWVAGFVLAVGWVKRKLESNPPESAKFLRRAVLTASVIGVSVTAAGHGPQLFAPAVERFGPVRKLDPTARLRGWRYLASNVDALRDEVKRETGVEPHVSGMVWTLPGELGFYCRGNPRVYSFGTALLDRRSQYDEWRPNPIADAQAFAGAPFVYVGDAIPAGVFDRLGQPTRVEYRENGVIVASWTVWVGYGFRGFPAVPAPRF